MNVEEWLVFFLWNVGAIILGWFIPVYLLTTLQEWDLLSQRKIHPRPWTDIPLEFQLHSLDQDFQVLVFQALVGNTFLYWMFFQGLVLEAPWPSLSGFLWDSLVMWMWADASFYWLHRLFHTNLLYRFHKHHHRHHHTSALAAIFAHPLETLLVNGLSTYGFLFFFQPNLWSFLLFVALRFEESVEEHSGFDLPTPWKLLRSTRHHEWHHRESLGNYGTFPFWDWYMGTDYHFQRAEHYRKANEKKVE